MICQNCRAEIADGTAYCPYCGKATQNNYQQPYYGQQSAPQQNPYQQPPYGQNAYAPNQGGFPPPPNNFYGNVSPTSRLIADYESKASTMKILGIVATVLMFGIGIIFSIAIWVMKSSITAPPIATLDPIELHRIQEANKKISLATTLSFIPIAGLILSFAIGFMIGFMGVL